MGFSYDQIIALEHPYDEFSNGDALAENVDVLNALSTKEKNTLATKIIAECPAVKFKHYGLQIEALRHLTKTQETFHSVIAEAYQVRQRIFALIDPRNKTPHTVLIGKEFNPGLFHRFNDLAQQVLKSNEPAIAERLALCAPEDMRSKIARNIDIAFPKSALSTKMQAAFTLRRNIDRLLLGDKPEQFFISLDYDKDTCNLFANMFRTLLKGHEAEISAKLAAVVSVDTRAKVMHQLDLLSTEVFDQTNPFKQIAEVVGAKISSEQVKSATQVTQATNPNGLFGKPVTPSEELAVSRAKESAYDEESDEEEESDNDHSFFSNPLSSSF